MGGVFGGEGGMFWEDGRVYVGGFVGGEMEGKGSYTWKDGKEYTGGY